MMDKERKADEELVFGDMTDAEIKKAMFWAAFEYLKIHGIGILPTWEDEIAFRKFMAKLDGLVEKYGKKSQTPTKDTERRPIDMEYRFADWKAYHEFMDAHKTELREGDTITIEKPIMPGAFPVTTFEVVEPWSEVPEKEPREADYKWEVPNHDHD